MEVAADSLFLSHPDPMWIYDLETLRYLAVNNAAIVKYGYSRAEFLAMTIADIRPAEDRAALLKNVAAVEEGRKEGGIWRHRLKSGEIIFVDISGHTIDHEGRRAELIAARDVSRLVCAERTAQEALERERVARQSSESLARQFQIMFDAVPGKFLALSPETFDVFAVSEAFLAASGLTRKDIVGRNLFEGISLPPQHRARADLIASFERVLATGQQDLLEVQRFPLHGDRERHWVMSSTPVSGSDGRPLYLLLRMQDVTEAVAEGAHGTAIQNVSAMERARIDLVAHTRDLKSDNLRLSELAARLRTTQRLLDTGTWDYLLSGDQLVWSPNVYDIYGVTADSFGHGFEEYVALVHPDDRAAMRANFDAFTASGDTHFSFAHRVVHPDGRIVHVHGVAEKTATTEGAVLRGVVQNVTDRVEAASALAQASRLLEIAGTSAKFGAWRYDVRTDVLGWSAETARIHDEPDGFAPSIAGAIAYFVPEHRDRTGALFQACLDRGEPFDDSLEIITAKGRRLWVRSTGEAERDGSGRITAIQGSFQDITELVMIRKRAEESEHLLEIAGRATKLGGWRVSLASQTVSWTDGMAAIHELPPGTSPTYEGGVNYFAPEEWEEAHKVFAACAKDGIPFDNIRDLITAKGNRIKVRSFGAPVRDAAGRITAVQGAMQDISELVAAQQKAYELSESLAETLENIGDAFFTLDRDWRFAYLNRRAEVLLERRRDEIIGRRVFDEFPDAVGTEFDIQYTRAFDTGETVRFEQYFLPLKRLLNVTAHPTPTGLAVYFTDITEDRRRDEQLRLLDAAVSRINDIVIITEVDETDAADHSRIAFVNDAFVRRTGFEREEAIGQTPRILQGPRTQRSELDRIRNALKTFTPVRTEIINYTKTGQDYWLEVDIMPIANSNGRFTHFVAVQRDITERKQAEQLLQTTEERFRLIAKATGNAVWEWDIATDRQWWSEGLEKIFGHQPDPAEAVPTIWSAHVHPDDAARVDDVFNRLRSGQQELMKEQYRFRRADGDWAQVEDRAFVLRNADGKITRLLGCMTDISERLALEERLRQAQKMEAVGQLTGGVAHDFNNLLTIVLGNAEILSEGLHDRPQLQRFADMTISAADRGAELTNRLLAFSRKQPLDPQVIDVGQLIHGMDGMLRRTLPENIDIQMVRSGGLWKAELDAGQLESALLNLALNARDAMSDGGCLTIETANAALDDDYVAKEYDVKSGQYVMIVVTDTGHGMTQDVVRRVFEPFFTTKSLGKGSGLGLSMVFGFVKQSGGHIRVYSELGQGTSFKLYFPRSRATYQPVSPSQTVYRTNGGNEKILVVEDDDLVREYVTTLINGMGYRVYEASSGHAAIDILNEVPDIDLLFTDVVMPGGMGGRELANSARALRPTLKILYTSGYTENSIVHNGRLDVGVDLLSKPYRREQLDIKLRKVLDSR